MTVFLYFRLLNGYSNFRLMKLFFTFILLVLFYFKAFSQEFAGKIVFENQSPISGVSVINIKNLQTVISDSEGNFKIAANPGNEIRFIKDGYERKEFLLTPQSFQEKQTIVLQSKTIQIQEVKLKPQMSGNLEKDSKQFNPSAKKTALLKDLNRYVKENPLEIKPPKFEAGQLSLISVSSDGSAGGIASAITGLFIKPKSKPVNNYFSRESFFQNVKNSIDRETFTNIGVSDYQLDIYLMKVITKYKLYGKNTDAKEVERLVYDEVRTEAPLKKLQE